MGSIDTAPVGEGLGRHLQKILSPDLLRKVYHLRFQWPKNSPLSGKEVGHTLFDPSDEFEQSAYDLFYHQALIPLSKIPLETLLDFDMTTLLPAPTADDYPEQALGLIYVLDQQRGLTAGYGKRYTGAFFEPVCEKLARQLVRQPDALRPDWKHAWLQRGYSFEDWLIRALWCWAPLCHSGDFMVAHRQMLKDWLHTMRAEVEAYSKTKDPFAELEAADDTNLTLFSQIVRDGPPSISYIHKGAEATVADFAFWYIRIINSHFAITDYCGRYPYWTRWKGLEYSNQDEEFLRQNEGFRTDPAMKPVEDQVRKDYLAGVWQPLPTNPHFESK